MTIDDKSSLELFRALRGMATSEKKAATAKATVTGNGYVLVDGATSPTPVASTTVDMVPGQTVKVEAIDGELHVVGNLSNPSTDDSTANKARAEAAEAGKTATNYMDFTTDEGLVVGNMTGGELGGNVQLTAEPAVNLRSGEDVMAKFGADGIKFFDENGIEVTRISGGKMRFDAKGNTTMYERGSNFYLNGYGMDHVYIQGGTSSSTYTTLTVADGKATVNKDFDVSGNVTADGSITAEGHSSPIGTKTSVSSNVTPSSSNINTYVAAPSALSLPAGTWVVVMQVRRNASGDGIFSARIMLNGSENSGVRLHCANNFSVYQCVGFLKSDSDMTVTGQISQNTSTFVENAVSLTAVRIA